MLEGEVSSILRVLRQQYILPTSPNYFLSVANVKASMHSFTQIFCYYAVFFKIIFFPK